MTYRGWRGTVKFDGVQWWDWSVFAQGDNRPKPAVADWGSASSELDAHRAMRKAIDRLERYSSGPSKKGA